MRIAIVNDVEVSIEVLKRIISTDPKYEIAWIAYNGLEAVKKCAQDTPDLILMDLIMPVMSGVEAIRQIMIHSPCAILITTATVAGHVSQVFQGMGCGALDVVRTPALDMSKPHFGGQELLKKIETIRQLIGKNQKYTGGKRNLEAAAGKVSPIPDLVVIGCSTGGPSALSMILSSFPKPLDFSVVILQHIDQEFTEGFAKWLSNQTSLPVQVASEGMALKAGEVLIAGKNEHLVLSKNLTLKYVNEPEENPYRPSIDEFFISVARQWPKKSVAVLLTGMGSDGALGLRELKEAGWYTIVQDEESCIVFGMPKAAIEIGAAFEVLPLQEIGPEMMKRLKQPFRK